MDTRAEIIDTGSRWARAARITIDAPASAIFDVLADPAQHPLIDGSGTVLGPVASPDRLALGSRFGMGMRLGLPYRTDNKVVEFEEGRLIAWCHLNRHRWRYELEPLVDGSTSVTETFDGRTAWVPASLLLMDAYRKNQVAVARTLVRLKAHVDGTEDAA